MATDAQTKANQKNAQLSTGPTSSTGKAKSSLNAVKTGLTGRTVLLPGDDAEAYQKHVASFFDRWKPEADDQRNLVQSLADTEWRLLRIPALEMGIYALGRLEFAAEFAKEDEAVRKHLIEARILSHLPQGPEQPEHSRIASSPPARKRHRGVADAQGAAPASGEGPAEQSGQSLHRGGQRRNQ